MAVVEVQDLARSYGQFMALKGISFQIEAGEVVGLLGPNGAGKTTTMRILTGFLAPTGGRALVCGHDCLADPIVVRRDIGYLPESAPIYPDMDVQDYLDFVGRVRGLGSATRSRAIERVVDECGLSDRLRQRVGTLSRGYRQRVGLAQALLHSPPLLILDEPTNGLDPNQIIEIRNIIRRVGETRTVMLSTHILQEVEATCGRVVIIHNGSVVADGATNAIVTGASGHRLVVGLGPGKVKASEDELVAQLCEIDHVDRVEVITPVDEAHRLLVYARQDVREAVFRWAVARGHVLVGMSSERLNLEEVFRRLTRSDQAA